ncbi:MAG: hypothetical protein M3Y73_11475 [Actinomycetota bacterium]|nr:hypothetical protein [Actinomycetota bacterium]
MWSDRFPRGFIVGGSAVVAAAVSALVVGVPTDVIDTPWFTRMTPVRVWEYPVLVLTALLTGAWFGLRAAGPQRSGADSRVLGSSILSAFAVGCPICNKIVIALLGVSGALGIWAPVQPVLGALSVAVLATAVWLRWRGRRCTSDSCPTDDEMRGAGAAVAPPGVDVADLRR